MEGSIGLDIVWVAMVNAQAHVATSCWWDEVPLGFGGFDISTDDAIGADCDSPAPGAEEEENAGAQWGRTFLLPRYLGT